MQIQKYIKLLEENGYIVLTKVELNKIVQNAKLGKTSIVDKNGKIVGWKD